MPIFRIDFGMKSGEYKGTQYIDVPNKNTARSFAKGGYIFNTKERKLLSIKRVRNLEKEQKEMRRKIVVRRI